MRTSAGALTNASPTPSPATPGMVDRVMGKPQRWHGMDEDPPPRKIPLRASTATSWAWRAPLRSFGRVW
jgi:hypothetical protein